MKVLLDEDVPDPVAPLVRRLLRTHKVSQVRELSWNGKKDVHLLHDAAKRGFQVFITQNTAQFLDHRECAAIKKSGMHHVSYDVPTDGLRGLGLAAGALSAAIHPILAELEESTGQRIVKITGLDKSRKRFEVTDPTTDPPSPYWH